jgi:hypothetical protein
MTKPYSVGGTPSDLRSSIRAALAVVVEGHEGDVPVVDDFSEGDAATEVLKGTILHQHVEGHADPL